MKFDSFDDWWSYQSQHCAMFKAIPENMRELAQAIAKDAYSDGYHDGYDDGQGEL